jgi:hypothetical protein
MLRLTVHPGGRALVAYAADPAGSGLRGLTRRHVARCTSCREEVALARSLSVRLGSLPPDAPDPALLNRIHRSLAAGYQGPAPMVRRGRLRAPLATAALLAAGLGAVGLMRSRMPADDRAGRAARDEGLPPITLALLPPAVWAQEAQRNPVPRYPYVRRLDTSRLRRGELAFAERMIVDGYPASTARAGVVTLKPVRQDDGEAWLVASQWQNLNGNVADTAILRTADLALLYRSEHLGGVSRLTRHFKPDSGGNPGAVAAAGPGLNPVMNVSDLESLQLLLQALPLGRHWVGTVRAACLAKCSNGWLPLDLQVTGEETIEVPAGRYRTWRVEFDLAGLHHAWWVDQPTGLLVKLRTSTNSRDTAYERVLLAWLPG